VLMRPVGAGADIIEEPVDQPYGVREYGTRDLEGQLWYFHSGLERQTQLTAAGATEWAAT
jgi:uncharacterized glyoxalase superfamily protein PhnB